MTASYLVSAVLGLCIAVGMLILILEEARQHNETLTVGSKARRRPSSPPRNRKSVFPNRSIAWLFDSASDAIFLVDLASLEIVEANPAATELAGRAADKLIAGTLAGKTFARKLRRKPGRQFAGK